METELMKDMFVSLLGKPFGIVVFQLIEATQYTIYLSLIAFIGGGLIAAVLSIVAISPKKSLRGISQSYIWLFQSVPLLMLLFLLGLGLPRLFDLDIGAWAAAIISLVVYASAYLAEVWRGALHGISQGQWEGARSSGLSFYQTVRFVIIPQAIRAALAPTVGFMVQIIKGTSLAYIIGFHDLMTVGKRWANSPVKDTEPFIIFPIMALIYFALCFPLSVTARRLEARFSTSR